MRHEISMDDKTNHALVLMAKEDGVSGPDFLEKLVLAEDRRRHEETTAGGPRRVRCWLSTCKEPNARTYVDGGGC